MTEHTLVEALAGECASTIGALLDTPGTAAPADEKPELKWVLRLSFGGAATGTALLGFDEPGARQLARLVMALDEDPLDGAVLDTLKELCAQAVGALSQRTDFQGLRLADVSLGEDPGSDPALFRVNAGDRFTTVVAIWAASSPAIVATHAALQTQGEAAATAALPANLDVILDIDLPLSVRFGETEMTLHALTRICPGSVIDLGRSPDDPVDVLVNGRLVARGEVVVVGGNYGVRIIDVVGAADRLGTVGA